MEFIPKRFLLNQHRFIDKNNPIHEIRREKQRFYKNLVPILDREIRYDEYFMNWFCGFCDPYCFFKFKMKKNKPFFSFITYHQQYKLLRWVRYNFNFGEVDYANIYWRYYFLVTRRSHLLVLIEVFNGYFQMLRTLGQFYLWLKYYNKLKKTRYIFKIPSSIPPLFSSTYFLGLVDAIGRIRMSRMHKPQFKYRFQFRVRFVFYMDIPSTEIRLLEELRCLFESPYFIVRSSKTIRFLISKSSDLGILSSYLIRHKPFNRPLKVRFLNWFAALQYLRLKNIKYRRKDRFFELLFRYRQDYYKPRLKIKKPLELPWPATINYIDTLPPWDYDD